VSNIIQCNNSPPRCDCTYDTFVILSDNLRTLFCRSLTSLYDENKRKSSKKSALNVSMIIDNNTEHD